VTEDGGLLEVKNFNAAVANKYSEMDEPMRIPDADYIQCLHEATVRNVPHVYFAVLFGGQQFRYWKLEFTPAEKEAFIQRAAQWWGYVHSGLLPPPTNVEEAAVAYARSTEGIVTADAKMERMCDDLKLLKKQAKEIEAMIETGTFAVQNYMRENSTLINMAGETLVTWKSAKGSKRFDAKALKEALPETYAKFEIETAGSRRFLVK